MTSNTLYFHNPSNLFDPTPYGFCHTVKAPSNGEIVYISGQSGGEGKEHTLSENFRHQVQVLLANLDVALKSHDLGFNDVMKITILIVDHDMEKLTIWGEEMNKYWTTNTLPASTLIPVPALALEGMKIEVDAVAFKSV
mgnify:CR=1 FL=1